MREELRFPICRLSQLIGSGSLSPVELVEAYLENIDRLNPQLHAYITVTAERALEEARAAEREILQGQYRGALHGIPVGLKDIIDVASIPTTCASKIHAERVPEANAEVTDLLARAGAVLLGKHALYEFATAIPKADDHFPSARNPWDLKRTAGGSSSGAGAALAAGMCAGAVGTDTGGSIRGPAAYSGITGLKPTYDLVSRKGVVPLSWSLDHLGPMATSASGCAILLDAMTGSAGGPGSLGEYQATLSGEVKGLTVGVPWHEIGDGDGFSPDVLKAFRDAVKVLGDMGARIEEILLPELVKEVAGIYAVIASSEALAYHRRWLSERPQDYGGGFRHRQGVLYTAVDYVQAQRGRGALVREMRETMSSVDVLIAPTTAQTAPTLEDMSQGVQPLRSPVPTSIFNLIGGPSISVPCGFDQKGMPTGLMVSAGAGEDAVVLRVADAYQQHTDWHSRKPPI